MICVSMLGGLLPRDGGNTPPVSAHSLSEACVLAWESDMPLWVTWFIPTITQEPGGGDAGRLSFQPSIRNLLERLISEYEEDTCDVYREEAIAQAAGGSLGW